MVLRAATFPSFSFNTKQLAIVSARFCANTQFFILQLYNAAGAVVSLIKRNFHFGFKIVSPKIAFALLSLCSTCAAAKKLFKKIGETRTSFSAIAKQVVYISFVRILLSASASPK